MFVQFSLPVRRIFLEAVSNCVTNEKAGLVDRAVLFLLLFFVGVHHGLHEARQVHFLYVDRALNAVHRIRTAVRRTRIGTVGSAAGSFSATATSVTTIYIVTSVVVVSVVNVVMVMTVTVVVMPMSRCVQLAAWG